MDAGGKILDLAIILHGSSGRFAASLMSENSTAEELSAAWNDLDTIMCELRRVVAEAVG